MPGTSSGGVWPQTKLVLRSYDVEDMIEYMKVFVAALTALSRPVERATTQIGSLTIDARLIEQEWTQVPTRSSARDCSGLEKSVGCLRATSKEFCDLCRIFRGLHAQGGSAGYHAFEARALKLHVLSAQKSTAFRSPPGLRSAEGASLFSSQASALYRCRECPSCSPCIVDCFPS
jgi:hypothetical protein